MLSATTMVSRTTNKYSWQVTRMGILAMVNVIFAAENGLVTIPLKKPYQIVLMQSMLDIIDGSSSAMTSMLGVGDEKGWLAMLGDAF